jgi:hypothetical protein
MDTTILEPEADELPDRCEAEIRLLYSIAISVKRLADLAAKLDKKLPKELLNE